MSTNTVLSTRDLSVAKAKREAANIVDKLIAALEAIRDWREIDRETSRGQIHVMEQIAVAAPRCGTLDHTWRTVRPRQPLPR